MKVAALIPPTFSRVIILVSQRKLALNFKLSLGCLKFARLRKHAQGLFFLLTLWNTKRMCYKRS